MKNTVKITHLSSKNNLYQPACVLVPSPNEITISTPDILSVNCPKCLLTVQEQSHNHEDDFTEERHQADLDSARYEQEREKAIDIR